MRTSRWLKRVYVWVLFFIIILAATVCIAEPLISGDFDEDKIVSFGDLELLADDWLSSSAVADIDGSGRVTFKDYSFFAANWQKSVPSLVINEFMAENNINYADPQGDFDDWIEIYNTTNSPINLANMYITDDLGDLTKCQIPTGSPSQTTVPAHGFIIIWADKDSEDGPLHIETQLNADGEEIAIVAADGITVIDSLTFGNQLPDISYGSYPDGSDKHRYFGIPTPGAANNEGYLGIAPEPEFSRSSGIFTDNFPLTISVDSNTAVIRYTTDHSVPTGSSPVYTVPITISSTTEIIARSFEPGYADSVVEGNNFVKVSNEIANFSSNIPVVILDSFGYNIDAENNPELVYPYRNVYAVVIDTDDAGRATVTDEPDSKTRGGMRVRGWTSAGFPKRQYKFESWNYMGDDKDVSFLGMPADSDWVIHGPYSDKSLIRNYLTYRLARDMGNYAVRTELCEVFNNQNNGEVTYDDYAGVYVFMERIKIGGERLQSEKLEPTDNAEPEISGGYIIKQDKSSVSDYFNTNIYSKRLIYDEPNESELTYAQKNWIKNYCNQLETALSGSNFMDPINGYQKYIDPDSFIDHFIIAELSRNVDGFILSDYMFKPRNGRIQKGPVWDFNLAWGNADYRNAWLIEGWQNIQNSDLNDGSIAWLRRMFEDENFYLRCIDRWFALRENVLNTDNMMGRIQGYADELEEAHQRNFMKWNILGVYIWPNWFVGDTYREEIVFMKDWVHDRLLWIDSQFQNPPVFNQQGGEVPNNFALTMTAPEGTIYYTTDGSDPRLHGGAVNPAANIYTTPISFTKSTQVKARELDSGEWSALNEATFSVGPVKDSLRITELMYHPIDPNAEYVELKNVGSQAINLNLVHFTDGIDFTFGDYSLGVDEYVLVVQDIAAFEAKYGSGYPIAGEYTGLLNNAGEEIVLRDATGAEIHDFDYKGGWYDITDGGGFSLAVADEYSADINDWDLKDFWRPSSVIYGTPGDEEDASIPVLGSIVINEVLAHSHMTLPDWIEIYNTTSTPINISGWFLSDSENSDPNMKKYKIAAGTVINPYGYIVFNQQDHFGDTNNIGCNISFGLSEGGETVYLRSGDGGVITGYIEQEDFGASETNVAFGRYQKSTGTHNFVAMSTNTPDAANAYPKVGPVVINEIMYNPASDESDEEYLELHNITSSPVTLQTYDAVYGVYVPWLLEKGIDYTFPLGTTIPANGYLIVASNPAVFTSTYGSMPGGVSVLGPYDGKLNNGGEKVDFMMPGDKEPGEDRYYIRVDRLNYSDGHHPENFDGVDPWPTSPDGDGDSLSRIYEDAYGNDPNNWIGQAETPGSAN